MKVYCLFGLKCRGGALVSCLSFVSSTESDDEGVNRKKKITEGYLFIMRFVVLFV